MVLNKKLILILCVLFSFFEIAKPEDYIIKQNETLSSLLFEKDCAPIYGKKGCLKKTLELNPNIKNPNFIKPNTIIKLPEIQNYYNVNNEDPKLIFPKEISQNIEQNKINISLSKGYSKTIKQNSSINADSIIETSVSNLSFSTMLNHSYTINGFVSLVSLLNYNQSFANQSKFIIGAELNKKLTNYLNAEIGLSQKPYFDLIDNHFELKQKYMMDMSLKLNSVFFNKMRQITTVTINPFSHPIKNNQSLEINLIKEITFLNQPINVGGYLKQSNYTINSSSEKTINYGLMLAIDF